MAEHTGNVWTPVIALRREDAERLGYDSAESWQALVNASICDIAKAYKILPENLRWYAAFHQKPNQVHIHMILFSADPKEGYLTKEGIRQVKSVFARRIYHADRMHIYQQKDIARQELQTRTRRAMVECVARLGSAAVLQIPMPSAIMSVKERAVSRMYRVAVCEGEKNLREDLCAQCAAILSGLQMEHTVTPYSSAEELEAAFSAGAEFSLLCLDILMDGKTGMKLAQELRERDDRTSILFITGSTDFLKDGYSVRPIQYLLKPVSREDLEQAIKTDLRLYHQPRTVTFRVAGRTFVLPAEDILCAESRDHGSVLHTTHGEQFILCPLSQMQEYLPKDRFCRCHNSFIVNLFHIRRVSSRTIYLTDGRDLSIGRRYMEQFQDQFVRYLNQN